MKFPIDYGLGIVHSQIIPDRRNKMQNEIKLSAWEIAVIEIALRGYNTDGYSEFGIECLNKLREKIHNCEEMKIKMKNN